jgi:hypothetical protein
MTTPIQKPMSARDYRAHAEGVKSKRPSEIVTLKSGSVFELRRPDLQGYVVTGRLPQSLLAEGLKAWKNKGLPNAASLGDEEIANSLVFMREVVHDYCVKPKFVEFATKDDEIGAADMLREDFTEIFSWAMGYEGVAGLAGLQTFREGRAEPVARPRARRKKQRPKAVSVTETESFVS